MLREMQAEGKPLGSIDFNKLIPMPEELNIESGSRTDRGLELYKEFLKESAAVSEANLLAPEKERVAAKQAFVSKWAAKKKQDPECWKLGEKAFQNIQKYGCPTWYEWCNQHWGTKWNAYGCRPLDDKADTVEFLTAWDAVPELVKLLSKRYPQQEVAYCWADENLGFNVGEAVFKNGEEIDGNIPYGGSREAYELAAEITGMDLAERGLYLTPDQSTYEYQPEPPWHEKPQKKKGGKGKDR